MIFFARKSSSLFFTGVLAITLFLCATFAAPSVQAKTLTSEQISAILSLLYSFGADSATIADVGANLRGESVSTTTSSSFTLTRTLSLGAKGSDVSQLQQYLKSTGDYTYGEITGYFGSATQAAVQRYQARNNIVSSGTSATTGWGVVGPKTYQVIKAAFGTLPPNPTPLPTPVPVDSSCTLNGVTVQSGASATFYASQSVQSPATCTGASQSRTCTNGTLSGTYQYSSCVVDSPSTCSFNDATVQSGVSVTAYQSNSVAYGSTCTSQSRACSNGVLSGSYQYPSCTVGHPSSCTLNGVTVQSGASATFYSSQSVQSPATCSGVSQSKTCTNGTLSGTASYQYGSCVVGSPTTCAFNGASIASGSSVSAYQSSTVPFGQTCTSQSRACSNGVLSGSYQYGSCMVQHVSAPTCTLTATPVKITSGQSAMLAWTSTNATSISINQSIGVVTPVASSSKSVSPTANTTYTATVTGTGGTATCGATVAVSAPPPPPLQVISVSAPTTVVQQSEINLSKVSGGGRFIDASFPTITQNGERYWYNTNSFSWAKFKGTLDKPFTTKVWQKETGALFGESAFPDPPDGTRARYWFTNAYQNGPEVLAFIHVEYSSLVNGAWKENKGRVGLAWSKDYGESFKYLGNIIVPNLDPAQMNVTGTPYVIKDGYFYIYYLDLCVGPSNTVARAPVADVIAAARAGKVSPWMKYYNGGWTSPGIGGKCAELWDTTEGIIHSDAAHSTYTGKFYILRSISKDVATNRPASLKLYESTDGIAWTFAKDIVANMNVEFGYSYNTIVSENGVDNGTVGRKFYVFSDKDAARGGPNGVIQRWLVDLDSTAGN